MNQQKCQIFVIVSCALWILFLRGKSNIDRKLEEPVGMDDFICRSLKDGTDREGGCVHR